MIQTKIVIALLIIFSSLNLPVQGKKPIISIIYPRDNAIIAAVDSTFIFGSIEPASSRLIINGRKVSVHPGGGFIAFQPIYSGDFAFEIIGINNNDTTHLSCPVNISTPRISLSYDSLCIIKESNDKGNLILSKGDRLIVEFQGTPGCVAHFSIPGLADSVPMAEMPVQPQSYWGQSVFGQGTSTEAINIRGIYRGYFEIDPQKMNDSARLCYYLSTPGFNQVLNYIISNRSSDINYSILDLLKLPRHKILDSSAYFVQINPRGWPKMVEMIDSVQIIRVGPRKGYLSIFQPKGVITQAIGKEGEWLKVKLSMTQYGWVNEKSVKYLADGIPPTISYLRSIRTFSFPDRLIVEMPLSAKHPFRMEEEDSKTLLLDIFGVNSDTDWIRYDTDSLLDFITWFQIEPEQYRLRLKFRHSIWGYDIYYEGNVLKLQINKVPQQIALLKNKKIVIDPGHSSDPGAVGPTGLKEAKANLEIALALKKELELKGAKVIMTRHDMSDLPLNERPVIAKANNADLFISVHNNALPDGVNPFTNNGVSTYYYHPHSIALAKAIQGQMLKGTGLNDFGLYYGNLAVNRPTQYPAVLVECAFIILPEQEALLKTAAYQLQVARSIRLGIEDFLREYDRK